jgi:hypothetical protein
MRTVIVINKPLKREKWQNSGKQPETQRKSLFQSNRRALRT